MECAEKGNPMGRPKKVEVKTAPVVVEEVIEVQPHVVTRPSDDTVNDRVSPVLPSLNDEGQS